MHIDIVFQSGEFIYQSNEGLSAYIPLLISAAALFITILIYRNFDAKKTFIRLQIEEMVKFQNSFENTTFIIRRTINGNSLIDIRAISMFNEFTKNKKEFEYLFKSYPLLIETETYLHFNLFNYRSNFLIPKSIRTEIWNLITAKGAVSYFDTPSFDNIRLQQVNTFGGELLPGKTSNLSSTQIDNVHFQTFESFLSQIMKIKSETNRWLKKFGIKN